MTKSLAQKLLEVQQTIGAAVKDAANPFFKSQYADLNQILAMAKEALNPHGLVIVQGPGISESGKGYIESSIIDTESGQQVFCRVPFSGNEKNMQEIGAATTYGRRFGLVSLLALEQIDDDGNEASGRGKAESKPKPEARPEAKPKPPVAQPKPADVPAKAEVPRDVLNKQISAYSKVALDKKVMTQEALLALLKGYGASNKESLTDAQALELVAKLKEAVNNG